jgi:hypothetical protein
MLRSTFVSTASVGRQAAPDRAITKRLQKKSQPRTSAAPARLLHSDCPPFEAYQVLVNLVVRVELGLGLHLQFERWVARFAEQASEHWRGQ